MGGPKEVVSTYFRPEENATRKSTTVIPDAEGRTDRPLPQSIEGDPGLADFHKSHAGSRIDGENNLECSLRRLGGVCPEHTGQADPFRLGGNVGDFSPRRDQKAKQGGK